MSGIRRKAKGKIVVVGSTNTDMVIAGRMIPVPGETVSDGRFMMNPGGKGANQAVAVARLSAARGSCVFVAKVGDDLFGRETAARLRKDGIDARLVVDKSEPSGTALIMVDAKGQNVISVALGANGTLSPADLAPFEGEIRKASALLLQLETPLDTVVAAAKAAHDAGATVVLNPAPGAEASARPLRHAGLDHAERDGGRDPHGRQGRRRRVRPQGEGMVPAARRRTRPGHARFKGRLLR